MLYQLSTIELPLFQSSYGALNCRRAAPAKECSLLEKRFRNSLGSGFGTRAQFWQQEAPFAGNRGQFQQPQQTTGVFSPERLSSLATEDIQGEFQAVKDSQ